MSILRERLDDDARDRAVPQSLWDRLRSDPLRAPEHIALAAAERHAPVAADWAVDKRSRFAVSEHELALMAKKRHAQLARFSGAATGVGGIVTFLPDLASLAWIQSRLVFFVAASYGFDPTDRMRPAELLVLQHLYATPEEARSALDGAAASIIETYVGSKLQRDEAIAMRLLRMVGKRTVTRVAGRLIPGLAIMVNAVGNERDTRALADRAIRFYGG
jgi:hypothetical protein